MVKLSPSGLRKINIYVWHKTTGITRSVAYSYFMGQINSIKTTAGANVFNY